MIGWLQISEATQALMVLKRVIISFSAVHFEDAYENEQDRMQSIFEEQSSGRSRE